MSLEELRDDLKRNLAEAKRITNVQELRDHLVNTLWPFLEAKLDVVEEMDEAVAELVDQQEDYLQPETAAVFAAVIQSSLQLAAELKKRAGSDATIAAQLLQHQQICEQAVMVLGEITMVPEEGDEEDDDEGEDDGETDTTEDSKEGSNE